MTGLLDMGDRHLEEDLTAPSPTTKVYVVSFRSLGSDGFDWFADRDDALAHFEKEKAHRNLNNPETCYEVRYVGEVEVPFPVNYGDEITTWLDARCSDLWDFDVRWNFDPPRED